MDLISELKKASIIPDVLTSFVPKVSVEASWSDVTAEIGNTVKPSAVQDQPKIKLLTPSAHDTQHIPGGPLKSGTQLTLALTDPDAPSRDNPEWSQFCHWVVTNVPLSRLVPVASDDGDADPKNLKDIVEYKPPGPPPKTGKHRYIFVALAPKNGSTEKLKLTTPGDRKHWGYKGDKPRQGVHEWAEDNGLEVVGANFVYAQNDEQ